MLNFFIGCCVGCMFGVAGFIWGESFAIAVDRKDEDEDEVDFELQPLEPGRKYILKAKGGNKKHE